MQDSTNWYWYKHPQKQAIIVTTHIILHPRLEVVGIIDVKYMHKTVCNRVQAKTIIQRHHICLTYYDYDCILDEIDLQKK